MHEVLQGRNSWSHFLAIAQAPWLQCLYPRDKSQHWKQGRNTMFSHMWTEWLTAVLHRAGQPHILHTTWHRSETGWFNARLCNNLLDFKEARFPERMKMFELQTQIEYCIQTGSHQNWECSNGLIQQRGKMPKYNREWSQAYRCKRHGEGRHKSEKFDVKWNTPCSLKLESTAFLWAWLLLTEQEEQILELTVYACLGA